MKPKDITELPERIEYEFGDWLFSIFNMDQVFLEMFMRDGRGIIAQSYIEIPRLAWDQMESKYRELCSASFWEKGEDDENLFIETTTGHWQLHVSRFQYLSPKRKKKKEDILVRCYSQDKKTAIAGIFIRRRDFDKIVSWYNSDMETA